MAIDALSPDPPAPRSTTSSLDRKSAPRRNGWSTPLALLNNGEVWSAYHATADLDRQGDRRALVTRAKIAIELGRFDTARQLLSGHGPSEGASTNRLLTEAELAARTGRYAEHHGLVVRLARYHDLTDPQVGALALQTAEIAVLTDHYELARRMFATATDKLRGSPVHQIRCLIGWQRIADSSGALAAAAATISNTAVVDRHGPLGCLARLLDVTTGSGATIDEVAEIRSIRFGLLNAGLVDLSQRALTLLKVRTMASEHPEVTPTTAVTSAAQCPWVTNDELFAAAERAVELGVESHFWIDVVGCRLDESPHPAVASETGEVVEWTREIRRQELENAALDQSIAQMRDRWRDLANLTSNEIRGLLTSLDAASYLDDADGNAPRGLELGIVHRIGALATMTLLGASELPNGLRTERPCKLRSLLATVLAEEQPIFDWQGNVLVSQLDIDDDVEVEVDASVLNDLVRWLIISASTGHLSRTEVEVAATATDQAVEVRISSSGDTIDPPWNRQMLGMSRTTVAYRAAAVTLGAWNGSFDVVYKNSCAELLLTLPVMKRHAAPSPGLLAPAARRRSARR